MFVRKLGLLSLILILPFAALGDGEKVETIGPLTDQSASETLRGALDSTGYRVKAADGSEVCDIWLRKSVASKENSTTPGVLLSEVSDSALVGVISFPKATTDFRGQALKAGTYTMRYGLHPTDGNHMGISTYRDFLILVPVADDKDPDAKIEFKDLMKMSTKASGTNHPAPLDVVYPQGQGDSPSVTEDDQEHLVFETKLKTQSGNTMPFAFIVKGIAEQ